MYIHAEVKCPECGSERVQARSRPDPNYKGRHFSETVCEVCGHKLTFEEIGRQVIRQAVKSSNDTV
jgi:hypothetical protein